MFLDELSDVGLGAQSGLSDDLAEAVRSGVLCDIVPRRVA